LKIDPKTFIEDLKELNDRVQNPWDDPAPDTTLSLTQDLLHLAILELERMYATDTEVMKEDLRTMLLECVNRLDE